MTEFPGATGLVLNEPLLWEQGRKGRCGFSLPRRDVERSAVPEGLAGDPPSRLTGAAGAGSTTSNTRQR